MLLFLGGRLLLGAFTVWSVWVIGVRALAEYGVLGVVGAVFLFPIMPVAASVVVGLEHHSWPLALLLLCVPGVAAAMMYTAAKLSP